MSFTEATEAIALLRRLELMGRKHHRKHSAELQH
jgi:hypothetical protein